MNTSRAAIDLRGLGKRFGAVQAVDAVTFSVEPGEIFGLMGHNGAGKTTPCGCFLDSHIRRSAARLFSVTTSSVMLSMFAESQATCQAHTRCRPKCLPGNFFTISRRCSPFRARLRRSEPKRYSNASASVQRQDENCAASRLG